MGFDRPDQLRQTGYEEGDFLSLLQFGTPANAFVSSDTYTDVYVGNLDQLRIVWDTVFPSSATTQVYLTCRVVDPSPTTLDIRLQNTEDGETAAEVTGLTNVADFQEVGPTDYTPTTTTGVTFRVQIRNGNNTDTVGIQDAAVHFGIRL